MPDTHDWRALYPFASRWLDLDGVRYHYLDEGEGEPLLLVHGNPTWSFYWREIVRGLRKEYRLIVPDHIGCGLSDKPQQYEYRLARHVDNLRRLIDRLQLERATLLAHDWGGAIGLGAALAEPERFKRFVLFNTAAFRSKRVPWRIRVCRTPVLGKLAVRGLNAFARAALSMAVAKSERMTPAVRNGLLTPYDSWANRIAIDRFVKDIPLSPRHPSYTTLEGIERGLPSLADRPFLFIWGMQDWCFTPHFLERFLEFFPGAEVHRLFDASHYVIEDAHEQIVPIVERFLDRNPVTGSVRVT
ncbi:MAG TPA: alpha/beta fold hydrolase [Pirellulales bacterium]|jgi:pimeloyl-ACP methyl ester carboxylesterase|nr:alpha/beta fold hydrolase [Pirellulales bacterium]